MSMREDVFAVANALFEAEKTGTQIGLLTKANPEMDMEDAYRVQSALVDHKLGAGRKIIGWKIGLTSKAMQDALKIDIPDSGILFDDMLFENGATIPKGRFIQPRIEAEIAFIMKEDLKGPDVGRDEVIAATESLAPSLEILDTRIVRQDVETGAIRKVFDTIADNAANAGLVLGNERFDPSEIDMRWAGAIAKRNGEVEETGLGAGVLDDPATSVAWLANRLAIYGDHIRAGDIVLSGSFIRPIEATPGSRFDADFGTFGSVTCQFE